LGRSGELELELPDQASVEGNDFLAVGQEADLQLAERVPVEELIVKFVHLEVESFELGVELTGDDPAVLAELDIPPRQEAQLSEKTREAILGHEGNRVDPGERTQGARQGAQMHC
jgi:hypothetical protein